MKESIENSTHFAYVVWSRDAGPGYCTSDLDMALDMAGIVDNDDRHSARVNLFKEGRCNGQCSARLVSTFITRMLVDRRS